LPASYNSFAIVRTIPCLEAGYYYYFKYKDDQWTMIQQLMIIFSIYVSNDNSYKVWMGVSERYRLLENNHWTLSLPLLYGYNYFAWMTHQISGYKEPIKNILCEIRRFRMEFIPIIPPYSEIRAFDVDKNAISGYHQTKGLFSFSSNGVLIKKVSNFYNIFFIKGR